MPTLNWIGKDKVVNHHQDVPYKVLEHKYGFKDGKQGKDEVDTGNMIIQGDNLEALKSLLPKYEGKIDCIYIDPPYNTGNEGWVYNDNVNHPKIKKWLGEVVGKEGDDLTRHDKWLCMMYPRLQLLYKLLSPSGVIFISIDDNEAEFLGLVLDEIFGRSNRINNIIWKKTYGGGAKSKHVVNLHEYVFFYAKNKSNIPILELPPDDTVLKYYKHKDAKFEKRGPYRLQPLGTTSMDYRPNLVYPIEYNGDKILPKKQWQWSQSRVIEALANDDLVIQKNNKTGDYSVNYKQYLKNENGKTRGKKFYSIVEDIYTQIGSNELQKIFDEKVFNFPKPYQLIKKLIQLLDNKELIVLDSFAGSGTTAHAILNLNKEDGGNRKFIMIEMEDYADSITAERVKRVIKGYGEDKKKVDGTGGSFDCYELGQPLFLEDEILNEEVGLEKIKEYIWFSETRTGITKSNSKHQHHLGSKDDVDYYFFYDKDQLTTLDYNFLSTIKAKATQYVIYADTCLLTDDFMSEHNITFKKIPRDITRF